MECGDETGEEVFTATGEEEGGDMECGDETGEEVFTVT